MYSYIILIFLSSRDKNNTSKTEILKEVKQQILFFYNFVFQ